MKAQLIPLFATTVLLTSPLFSQTINWGSPVFSNLVDSNGATLDSNFVFELGSFTPDFTPLETNVNEWSANWNVFDAADYNGSLGYFAGTTEMTDDGLSLSQWLNADISSFEGLNAYLWIRKGDQPIPGSEWLVVRANDWIFPTATPGCCDNALPLEWSVSDLNGSNVPNWGNQGGNQGPGVYTVTDSQFTLQTYTFVPEPSAALLLAVGTLGAALLRRR